MSFATPKTACQDTVCLTAYLPDPPPPDVFSPMNPTSLPFSEFAAELSAAYTRLKGQCGDNSTNFNYTDMALGVTTLKDDVDIYAIRVYVWDGIAGKDHVMGGELE